MFVEAGAHGLPVVAGRIPGVVDAVHEGVTGRLVDPTDPEEMRRSTRCCVIPSLLRDWRMAAADGRELSWPGPWWSIATDSAIDSALSRAGLFERSDELDSRPCTRATAVDLNVLSEHRIALSIAGDARDPSAYSGAPASLLRALSDRDLTVEPISSDFGSASQRLLTNVLTLGFIGP